MTKYKFSMLERNTIWLAHDKKCFYCNEYVPFKELTIDHIIAEKFEDKPKEFLAIKTALGLVDEFSINSYYNWVPCHSSCNFKKGGTQFSDNPTRFFLELVNKKMDKIKKIESRLIEFSKKDDTIAKLSVLLEKEKISIEDLSDLLDYIKLSKIDFSKEPTVITFGVAIQERIDDGQHAPAGKNLREIAGWLLEDLEKYLNSIFTCEIEYAEIEDEIECISIRYIFKDVNSEEIKKFTHPWWEILEIEKFPTIYNETYQEYCSR